MCGGFYRNWHIPSFLRAHRRSDRTDLQNNDARQKQTGTGEEKLFDVYVSKLAVGLSRFVKLDPVKKNRLQTTLAIAGIHLTPESYTLKAYITALAVALPALPCFTFMPLFGFLLLGLAVMMWFATYYEAFDYVKRERKSLRRNCRALRLPLHTIWRMTGMLSKSCPPTAVWQVRSWGMNWT